MRYEGTIYRPPSEAHSLLIQATIGCPHNRCTFCSLYKGVKFKSRPIEEIKEDLQMAHSFYGDDPSIFPDGNTIIMKTRDLVDIFTYARQVSQPRTNNRLRFCTFRTRKARLQDQKLVSAVSIWYGKR